MRDHLRRMGLILCFATVVVRASTADDSERPVQLVRDQLRSGLAAVKEGRYSDGIDAAWRAIQASVKPRSDELSSALPSAPPGWSLVKSTGSVLNLDDMVDDTFDVSRVFQRSDGAELLVRWARTPADRRGEPDVGADASESEERFDCGVASVRRGELGVVVKFDIGPPKGFRHSILWLSGPPAIRSIDFAALLRKDAIEGLKRKAGGRIPPGWGVGLGERVLPFAAEWVASAVRGVELDHWDAAVMAARALLAAGRSGQFEVVRKHIVEGSSSSDVSWWAWTSRIYEQAPSASLTLRDEATESIMTIAISVPPKRVGNVLDAPASRVDGPESAVSIGKREFRSYNTNGLPVLETHLTKRAVLFQARLDRGAHAELVRRLAQIDLAAIEAALER